MHIRKKSIDFNNDFFLCIIGCVLVYVQIPMNSNLNWLKYIDPAYCLNAGDIFMKICKHKYFG